MFKTEFCKISAVKLMAFGLSLWLGIGCASGLFSKAGSEEAGAGGHTRQRHPCESPIENPGQVWKRIETVRRLPEKERTAKCGLGFVEILSPWRTVPVDLLDPIVEHAAKGDLVEWVRQRADENDKAAAQVVAMDLVHGWRPGSDPSYIRKNAERWRKAGVFRDSRSHLGNVFKEVDELSELLSRVTRVHQLRCLLEVNPLGFAVDCRPIHRQGIPVEVTWSTKTRDGLLEDIELKRCKGSICKKLKKTASELEDEYRDLISKVEKLKVAVFREEIERWLVLPPFSDGGA